MPSTCRPATVRAAFAVFTTQGTVSSGLPWAPSRAWTAVVKPPETCR